MKTVDDTRLDMFNEESDYCDITRRLVTNNTQEGAKFDIQNSPLRIGRKLRRQNCHGHSIKDRIRRFLDYRRFRKPLFSPDTKYTRCPEVMSTDDDALGESKELVGNSPSEKNWRGILIALLVILIVCSLIVVAVILVTPSSLFKTEEVKLGDPFTFDDLFNPEYQPRHFAARWLGDSSTFVYRSREGELMEFDAQENITRLIMDNSTFRRLNTDIFAVSPDRKYVLLAYDIIRVYRHSFRALYKIYDRYSPNANKLIDFPASQDGDWKEKYLQFAGWGTQSNALVFVYNNNLYYQADPHSTSNPITSSGGPLVCNAIPDWVYEEEILHSNAAHWWSPDSSYIAYAEFDDRNVPLYRFPYYGPLTNEYGDIEEIPYPKAGDPNPYINPRVKLFVMDTRNTRSTQKELKVPAQLANQEHYFTSVSWQDDNHVLIVWSNRPQNMSVITICDATSADCYVNQIEIAKEGGWVQVPKPIFIHNGQRYLMVLSEQDSNHGYWKHIAMITTPIGREGQRTYLTQGTWDVTDLVAYDPGDGSRPGYAYYIATNRDPRKRQLFRVEMISDHDQKLKTPECITCDMNELCQYVSVKFSGNAKYYILTCEGPGVPEVILKSTVDDRHVYLEDNAELKERLKDKAVPKAEYYELELKDGTTIWASVYLPPTLNKEHIIQYPLLVHTYGGPGTQKVTEQFQINWATYLSTSLNFIYAFIDGRGSGARGDRFLHAVHRKLGTIEVQDQIAGAVFLRDHMPYVDKERIGIWGWSYGGFVTGHALGDRDNDIFKCGIAVAPVTDWRYYDTVYTERFMGMSHNDNYRGYDNANVSAKAANFKGKKFMIVHGTADDNVHFQHSAQLIKSLTEADVDFRVQMYTDKNHAISGPKTSRHLYRTMTNFLRDECWEGAQPRMEDDYMKCSDETACESEKPKGKFAPKLKKKHRKKPTDTRQVQQYEGEEVLEKPGPTATAYRTQERNAQQG